MATYCFNTDVATYLQLVFNKSVLFLDEISTLEYYLQESIEPLDLALSSHPPGQIRPGVAGCSFRPPRLIHPSLWGRNWKIFSRTRVLSVLPALIKEFFLAEKLDENQLLTGMCSRVQQYNMNRVEDFRKTYESVMKHLFIDFETMLFVNIEYQDDNVKIRKISKYLKAYEVFQADRFSKKFPFLVKLCVPLNSKFTIEMVKILCNTNAQKLFVFNILSNKIDLIDLISKAQAERFDFWGLWSGSGILALEFDFHRYFMKQEYSRILLQFGFPYLANVEEYSLRCCFLEELVIGEERNPVVRTSRPLIEKAGRGHETRIGLIMDIFILFGGCNDLGNAENCIRTFVYLTRSLPEPYITPSELYLTMSEVVVPDFMPTLAAIVKKYSEAAIFDDEYDIYSPRRLKHLCRVSIRKKLLNNFKLPDGIKDLDIPGAFKSYLRLES